MSAELLLTAGRGPDECAWAVGRLLRRLEADAGRRGLVVDRLAAEPGGRPGTYRSVLLRVAGAGAGAFAAGWTGTLCWRAPSPYRPGRGRRNWYVAAGPPPARPGARVFAEADVTVTAVRTGGPGGQHRDKAGTAARAVHRPSGEAVVADTERTLTLNRRLAVERLRARLEGADRAAALRAAAEVWRSHGRVVRGDPVRVERPA